MDPIVPPGNAWSDDVLREGSYDEYQFDHAIGGAISGSAVLRGRSPATSPAHVPFAPLNADLSYAWRRGGDVTTTVTTEDPTSKAMNEITLGELMPEEDDCLPPLEADLCDGASLAERCAELETPIRPTRRALAEQALDAAGISLVILPGPAVGPIDTLAPADYRTVGLNPMQVFQDMLLRSDPRWWIDPGVITVDGRSLPLSDNIPPATPMTTPIAAWRDEAVNAGQVTVVSTEEPEAPEEPLLEDYTKECGEEPDECDGMTFETMRNGTLTWTENSGSGWGYVETEYTLVKVNGQITQENRTVKKNQFRLTGSLWPLDVSEFYLVVVEHSEKVNTYSECCPEALIHSIEQTWVPYWNRSDEWDPDNPFIYMSTYKEITQRWHAEGWMRQRTEVDGTLHAWTNVDAGGIPWYKTRVRAETYVPVGGGLWNVDTRINDTLIIPVREDGEIIDANDTLVTNAYTVITDAAPPTVSCEINPCDPDEDCTEKATRLWQEAHDEYEEAVAVAAAWRLNHPERRLTQVFALERIDTVNIGDLITTSRGEAIVTRVSWNGSGARDSAGDTVSIEAWSALSGGDEE